MLRRFTCVLGGYVYLSVRSPALCAQRPNVSYGRAGFQIHNVRPLGLRLAASVQLIPIAPKNVLRTAALLYSLANKKEQFSKLRIIPLH